MFQGRHGVSKDTLIDLLGYFSSVSERILAFLTACSSNTLTPDARQEQLGRCCTCMFSRNHYHGAQEFDSRCNWIVNMKLQIPEWPDLQSRKSCPTRLCTMRMNNKGIIYIRQPKVRERMLCLIPWLSCTLLFGWRITFRLIHKGTIMGLLQIFPLPR